jgi:uncharacterized protein (TIGR03437 family)
LFRRFQLLAALLVAAAAPLSGHAPPAYIPVLPLHIAANRLVDATGSPFLLRGVNYPGLEAASPTAVELAAQAAMTSHTFRVIQQRWNTNAVRLPVSSGVWKRDGAAYLDRVAAAVAAANGEGLVVVLAAYQDAHSGAASDTGMPTADLPQFWTACAQRFHDTPGVIFSLFGEPSTRNIAGAADGAHRASDWQFWLNGGTLAGGQTAAGMQSLVDAIRAAGATHVISAPAFQDALGFQGFTSAAALHDANIIYEGNAGYDLALTDDARDRSFGFLAFDYPVYAVWGMTFGRNDAACNAIPPAIPQASDILFQTVAYFDSRGISWTVADFTPGSLIQDYTDFPATILNGRWTCDASSDPRVGIGQFVLLFLTGDPNGFGSLDPNLIASAANGFGGQPVAPGELINVYGQGVGPFDPLGAQLDDTGRVTSSLGGLQVLFDGVPAPILLAGAFQSTVQVPYEVAGRATTSMQLIYRGVASNVVAMPVADTAPGIFTVLGGTEVSALNQDGTVNGASNPAPRGSVLTVFATGCGQMTPAGATGVPASAAFAQPGISAAIAIATRPAEVLYAGSAPGLVGVTQFNVRIPPDVPVEGDSDRASIALTIGGLTSRQGIVFWVQ